MHIKNSSFYFLRHGQTDWNAERRCMGSTDIPLNETGRAQAHEVRDRTSLLGIKAILASPLSRAHDTAQIVALDHGFTPHIVPELVERGWGEFEGRVADPDRRKWRGDSDVREMLSKGAEDYDVFRARIARGLAIALEQHESPALLVSHSGVFKLLCNYLNTAVLGANNASLFLFAHLDGTWWVEEII